LASKENFLLTDFEAFTPTTATIEGRRTRIATYGEKWLMSE